MPNRTKYSIDQTYVVFEQNCPCKGIDDQFYTVREAIGEPKPKCPTCRVEFKPSKTLTPMSEREKRIEELLKNPGQPEKLVISIKKVMERKAKEPHPFTFVMIGRVPDGENEQNLVQAMSYGEAVKRFIELHLDFPDSQADTIKKHGVAVYFESIVAVKPTFCIHLENGVEISDEAIGYAK